MKSKYAGLILAALCACQCMAQRRAQGMPESLSGIYPRLAMYNHEGECGTGAVVPWNDRLWVISYGPHLPKGSSDKLYEITPDMKQTVRQESIGGTPANRMIHQESRQLFIGPYVISADGHVRTIPYSVMPGRLTGNARHLTDPANKIYYATMEEGFYEVDVHNLNVKELYPDGNYIKREKNAAEAGPVNDLLPGVHGKGLYSGQGVMVFSNNGEGTQEALQKFNVKAGVLAEWNGKDWSVVRRNQFVEVTGPGGIYGNKNPETDPIWATGWDYKSIIVGVRDSRLGWSFYRLPKASHSYDGAHGWNTEWPRIRNVGTEEKPDYLMTMHGMFWHFPAGFTADHSAGIRPRSAYLKVIGDFTRWNNRLVFGCDDSAQNEFLNKRREKGLIEGPGQSNSNLWFTSLTTPDELGTKTACGSVWDNERIKAGEYSESFLFAGWDYRMAWLRNGGAQDVIFSMEVDKTGDGKWTALRNVEVKAGESVHLSFKPQEQGEWIRLKSDRDALATVCFNYTGREERAAKPAAIFTGLTSVQEDKSIGGLLYSLGKDRRALGIVSQTIEKGQVTDNGYYEMGENFELVKKDDPATASFIKEKFAIPKQIVTVDKGSVLIIDSKNRRWRLPLGNGKYTELMKEGEVRLCREVATERDMFNCHGTIYELPAENADGYAKIRPVASHNWRIHDYASYRGMMLFTGITPEKAGGNEHIIISKDGKAAVWAGVIDDLWKIGKPVGNGGPWVNEEVKAGVPSDAYLIGSYDKKRLALTNEGRDVATFTVEADPSGNGHWMTYMKCRIEAGKTLKHRFPASFQARWIRFIADKNTRATAMLEYR